MIYNGTFCLLYLLNDCYDGIEQLCDYESAEDYSFTKLSLNLLTTYQNNSSIHRAIQKNIMSIFLLLSKIKNGKDIMKIAFQQGIIKKLISSIRNYPDSIEIKKISCWLLTVFIIFTQNKVYKDIDSDFDSEDDEFLDDELPQTVLDLNEENLLKNQLKRNSVQKLIARLINFIECTKEKIEKEKEEIKLAKEKREELRLKMQEKEQAINDGVTSNKIENGKKEEGEFETNNTSEIIQDELDATNLKIPERKTFLDDHFVQCVYGAQEALEWFTNYMDSMDKARDVLEKIALQAETETEKGAIKK